MSTDWDITTRAASRRARSSASSNDDVVMLDSAPSSTRFSNRRRTAPVSYAESDDESELSDVPMDFDCNSDNDVNDVNMEWDNDSDSELSDAPTELESEFEWEYTHVSNSPSPPQTSTYQRQAHRKRWVIESDSEDDTETERSSRFRKKTRLNEFANSNVNQSGPSTMQTAAIPLSQQDREITRAIFSMGTFTNAPITQLAVVADQDSVKQQRFYVRTHFSAWPKKQWNRLRRQGTYHDVKLANVLTEDIARQYWWPVKDNIYLPRPQQCLKEHGMSRIRIDIPNGRHWIVETALEKLDMAVKPYRVYSHLSSISHVPVHHLVQMAKTFKPQDGDFKGAFANLDDANYYAATIFRDEKVKTHREFPIAMSFDSHAPPQIADEIRATMVDATNSQTGLSMWTLLNSKHALYVWVQHMPTA